MERDNGTVANGLSNGAGSDTKTTKKPTFSGGKNMWKRITHLMQRHQTSRKGYSTIYKEKSKATVQFLKA